MQNLIWREIFQPWHIVQNEKFTLARKIFHKINSLVTSILTRLKVFTPWRVATNATEWLLWRARGILPSKVLLSRNFWSKKCDSRFLKFPNCALASCKNHKCAAHTLKSSSFHEKNENFLFFTYKEISLWLVINRVCKYLVG